MKKRIAYCCLHYGQEFLKDAILSIEPFVDKIMIFYSPKPTFGFGTEIDCPEKGEDLQAIAEAASPKVHFVSGYWGDEGTHRHVIFDYCGGYDTVIVFDSDEIFEQKDLPAALDHVEKGEFRYYGVEGYITFWKSLDWHVVDHFRPVRFYNLHNIGGQSEVHQTIYHFSLCQSKRVLDYKFLVHGHKDEFKSDWYQEKFVNWNVNNALSFLHPTSNDIWHHALPFDRKILPEFIQQYPY